MTPRGSTKHYHASSLSGFTVMNIFNTLRVYAGKWSEKNVRAFTPEEIEAVAATKVVESQYGLSVCFTMTSGGNSYIPLDQSSTLTVNNTVDLIKAQLVTLQRQGEDDIYRVRI